MSFVSKSFIDYFVVCGLDVKSGLELESTREPYDFDGGGGGASSNCSSGGGIATKSPLERSYKCRVLNHFPDSLPWNPFDEDAVAQLCLPKGLVFQKHNTKPKFHPFIITRMDGSRIYGGTLTFFELIEDDSICNAMQSLQTMYDAELSHSFMSSAATTASQSSTGGRMPYQRSVSNHYNPVNTVGAAPASQSVSTTTPVTTRIGQVRNESSPSLFTGDSVLTNESVLTSLDHDTSSTQNGHNESDLAVNHTPQHENSFEPASSSLAKKFHNKNLNRLNLAHTKAVTTVITAANPQSPSFSMSFASPTKTMHYNILKDRLYASKCICVVSQQPFNKAFNRILQTLYDMVEQTDLLGISLESHIYNLIYEVSMPMPKQLMQFHVGCKATQVYMPDYLSGKDLPLFDYDLSEFFRLLGVSNVINLFVTALLEHQILLYSKDYYLLMLVAESLSALFFPFTWLKTYVPIVPASNLHFIDAPVPYIMGFHHRDIDKEFFKQGQRCFVDIDSGTVHLPEGVPDFPDKNKFVKEINELIVHFQDKRSTLKLKKQVTYHDHPHRQSTESTPSTRASRRSTDYGGGNSSPPTAGKQADERLSDSMDEQSSAANSSLNILHNSQAFARITELARKTGALSSNEEYILDKATGRLKSMRRGEAPQESGAVTLNMVTDNISISSSSGVSSLSSLPSQQDPSTSDFVVLNNSNSNAVAANRQAPLETGGGDQQQQLMLLAIDEEELINLQFTRCIRELFLQKFVQMFASYEKFVIVPSNIDKDKADSWWREREYAGNFDSKMFLIEQPSPRLPFLSHFIATQMFATFIDHKVFSVLSKKEDPNVKIFDERIKHYKEACESTNGINYDLKVEANRCLVDVKDLETDLSNKMASISVHAPTVHSLDKNSEYCNKLSIRNELKNRTFDMSDSSKKESHYLFENIDNRLLKADEEMLCKAFNEYQAHNKRDVFANQQLKLSLDKQEKPHKENKHRKNKKDKVVELNPILTQSLLNESKLKTKRMLVEKMPEAVNIGHGEARISGVEENMLIASLCDLLERIWSHGLHGKPGKSALWNHLINYRKLIQYLHPSSQSTTIDAKTTSPRSHTLPRKRSTLALLTGNPIQESQASPIMSPSRYRGSSTNPHGGSHVTQHHKRAQSVNNSDSQHQTFPPMKNDLLDDLACIDKLTEVKTEIGMARAFVRLSLEKKLLADHLRQLLKEGELLRALYKKHAFLRQEEEREQFIYHLQSLIVVDYFSFSNYFRSIPTDYSVLIVPSKRFNSSTTSANAYIKLYGSLGESNEFIIPRNANEFVISCNTNLGPLTTLIIGHDNSGMTPKWMIENVFIRNEITGHITKFPCGRWFGRGVDDDSLERLLIAERINLNDPYEMQNMHHSGQGSRSPIGLRAEEKVQPQVIQEMMGNAINTLVKYFERSDTDKGVLTNLVCGDNGLVPCMEVIFTLGFKSYKLFKRLYIWDFLEKASFEFENILYANSTAAAPPTNNFNHNKLISSSPSLSNSNLVFEKFVKAVRSINSVSANYGKDGKFQIFICLACKECMLSDWFNLLGMSTTAHNMYDEYSFLRNYELNKFCVKILNLLKQFNFKLESSLTMGIQL